MTSYEMEEQLKNLDARTAAIERILPTLATRDDLRLTTEALQHGLEDAKRYALMLNEATRDDIRLLAEHMLAMRSQLDVMRSQLDVMRPQLDVMRSHLDVMRPQLDRIEGRRT